MFKTKRIISTLILACILITLSVPLVSCNESSPSITQKGSIEDITKGYFGSEGSEVKIDVSQYVNNPDGAAVTYKAVSSDPTVASAQISGSELTLTLLKGEGSSDISVSVEAGGAEVFKLTFKINAKSYKNIACIGDSLTYGHSWPDQAYPVYLAEKLGADFEVKNFGINGASVTGCAPLNKGYTDQTVYTESLAYDPDVVIIMLGTNDSKGWADAKDSFDDDYKALIQTYQSAFPDAKILLISAPVTMENNNFSIPNDVIEAQVYPRQLSIAQELEIPMLDFRKYMQENGDIEDYIRGQASDDGVHLTVDGAKTLADLIISEIFKF